MMIDYECVKAFAEFVFVNKKMLYEFNIKALKPVKISRCTSVQILFLHQSDKQSSVLINAKFFDYPFVRAFLT